MELKIKIPNDSEYLLKNNQFKIFLYEHFKFEDQRFNDKYNLNNIIIKIYNSLEENKEFIIYKPNFNYSDTIKLLKKQYGVYKNIIIPEFILKKFNLSIFNSLKTCYFNKVKVININNEIIEKTYTFYDKNKDNYAYFAVLNEIINHYYAYILYENYKKINKCEFKIPRLYKIIKDKDKNNNIKLTIQMEYISNIDILNYNEQQKQECEKLIIHPKSTGVFSFSSWSKYFFTCVFSTSSIDFFVEAFSSSIIFPVPYDLFGCINKSIRFEDKICFSPFESV